MAQHGYHWKWNRSHWYWWGDRIHCRLYDWRWAAFCPPHPRPLAPLRSSSSVSPRHLPWCARRTVAVEEASWSDANRTTMACNRSAAVAVALEFLCVAFLGSPQTDARMSHQVNGMAGGIIGAMLHLKRFLHLAVVCIQHPHLLATARVNVGIHGDGEYVVGHQIGQTKRHRLRLFQQQVAVECLECIATEYLNATVRLGNEWAVQMEKDLSDRRRHVAASNLLLRFRIIGRIDENSPTPSSSEKIVPQPLKLWLWRSSLNNKLYIQIQFKANIIYLSLWVWGNRTISLKWALAIQNRNGIKKQIFSQFV